jgi:hypothetical protein
MFLSQNRTDHREPEFSFNMFEPKGWQFLSPCSKTNARSSGMKNAMSKRGPVIEVSIFAVLHMNGRFSCGIAASFAQLMMVDFMPTDAVNVAKRQQRPSVPKQRMCWMSPRTDPVEVRTVTEN